MILTMILAGGSGERLRPLTNERAKPAVPFGGVYRIIDFSLSNCINSGLVQIYVLTQYKSQSLTEHLQGGWNISGMRDHFIYSIQAQQRTGLDWYRGTADAIRQSMHVLEDHKPENVLILSADHVYKMDYRLMIDYHRKRNADLTVAAIEVPKEDAINKLGVVEVDTDYRMTGFEEKPPEPKTIPDTENTLASMGIYLFNTDVLIDCLQVGGHDFGKDIIPKMLSHQKNNVHVYNYGKENAIKDHVFELREGERVKILVPRTKDSSYWRDVGTIEAYHNAHMDLIGVDPALDLYGDQWPLRTLRGNYPPAKFILGGIAPDSIISEGCIISGGIVTKSVLSPGVIVERNAQVEDSIIFNNVQVGAGARIRRAIIDKGVYIPPNTVIGDDLEADARRFTVESGIVVISKGLRI